MAGFSLYSSEVCKELWNVRKARQGLILIPTFLDLPLTRGLRGMWAWRNSSNDSPIGARVSREDQIFSQVIGLNRSDFELPDGFQSVGYQIASCGVCRFKPTTTRTYLWSIKHLDIKPSFWHRAWGQRSALSADLTWDFSAHMAWELLNFQACSSAGKKKLVWNLLEGK